LEDPAIEVLRFMSLKHVKQLTRCGHVQNLI